jgi:DNA-directed RNA polymerase subunit RPC12/RpoP
MAFDDLRTSLNRIPPWVAVILVVVVVGVGLWAGFLRAGEADYDQPDVVLKCSACGHRETLSMSAYESRVEKEKPGATALMEGPELVCPECGKKAMVPISEDSPDEKGGG